MKAKYYYAKLLECTQPDQLDPWLEETMNMFVNDTMDLIRTRCAKTREAIISIIKEVNQKWDVLVNLVDNGSANFRADNEKYFLRGFRLQPDGYKACFVHLHPEYKYAFDLESHKLKVQKQEEEAKKSRAAFVPHKVKPWEEITLDNVHQEVLACLMALGRYSQLGMPLPWLRPLVYRIDILKKWADSGIIDMNDVEIYNQKCAELEESNA